MSASLACPAGRNRECDDRRRHLQDPWPTSRHILISWCGASRHRAPDHRACRTPSRSGSSLPCSTDPASRQRRWRDRGRSAFLPRFRGSVVVILRDRLSADREPLPAAVIYDDRSALALACSSRPRGAELAGILGALRGIPWPEPPMLIRDQWRTVARLATARCRRRTLG